MDELKLNNNLIGLNGIIGRYNYFYNKTLILLIGSIVFSLFVTWFIFNTDTFSFEQSIWKTIIKNPVVLTLTLFTVIFTVFLDITNSIRRINDILGQINKRIQIASGVFIFILSFTLLLVPYIIAKELLFIKLLFDIFLLCKSGKITSTYPYDVAKQFNWGAFLGTWVWGLFNKSYITLWQIVLMCTPMGIPFALICGIKGNEWAYKNTKYDDADKFNKIQEKWANICIGIFVFSIPIFCILFYFAIFEIVTSDVDGFGDKFEAYIERTYIDSYEIKENENIFYIEANYWKNLNYKERFDILEAFSGIAVSKREKEAKLKNPNERQYYYRNEEMRRTKIYSSEKHELLAEYKEPPNVNRENYSIKDAFNDVVNGIKFYEPSK